MVVFGRVVSSYFVEKETTRPNYVSPAIQIGMNQKNNSLDKISKKCYYLTSRTQR